MTRCHICRRPCVREVEPAFGEHVPAVTAPDVHLVAMRNCIYVEACFACWFMWPDDHKIESEIAAEVAELPALELTR